MFRADLPSCDGRLLLSCPSHDALSESANATAFTVYW